MKHIKIPDFGSFITHFAEEKLTLIASSSILIYSKKNYLNWSKNAEADITNHRKRFAL